MNVTIEDTSLVTATARGDAPREGANLRPYDIDAVRSDFPILAREVHGQRLSYLDTAASAQKPRQVLDAMRAFYENEYSNIHRGAHHLAERATDRYEAARETVRRFLNARASCEIVFTRNVTEAINLVAQSYGRSFLAPGDEIVVTMLEHHANFVPWQVLSEEKGLVFKIAPVTDEGELDLDAFAALMGPRTKLVAASHMSNVLGTVLPARSIVEIAHDAGAKVLFDGAQAVVHRPVDVRELDCDFYAFTGHKLYGPSGIGVLYAKEDLLDRMPPYQTGGGMIRRVTAEKTTWADLPQKFEAGTPAIAEAVGLGAAIGYVTGLGIERIAAHEDAILDYAIRRLASVPGLVRLGAPRASAGLVSFTLDDVHAHDIATIVDSAGVAIRAGHHCAQPLMDRFGLTATARASFGLYTNEADVEALVVALGQVRELFS